MADRDDSARARADDVEQRRPWHAISPEEALDVRDTAPEGLSSDEAEDRLRQVGHNALEEQEGAQLHEIVLRQLKSPLIYMLVLAAVVSAAVDQLLDAGVILVVVVINTVIGVVQEWRAEEALAALRALSAPEARVLRDGETQVIKAEEVVPGDVLLLETGDRVAADARLLRARDLQVDESALTGESEPVGKGVEAVDEDAPLADRASMVWMSTPVTAGRGRAVVVATGMETAMGEIAGQVRGAERGRTPLQQRLDRLGIWIGGLAAMLAFAVFLLGILTGYELVEMMLFAVAVAVSSIPEGLPAVVSVVLAVGVRVMADRNAIVRRLPAVETLGSTTVICSDKTGTITRNQMTVTRVWAGGKTYDVEGEGFEPEGAIREQGKERDLSEGGDEGLPAELGMLVLAGVQANDSVLEHAEDRWRVSGDPTEGALLVVGRKAGVPEAETGFGRVDEIPFSSDYKYMATLDEPRPGEDSQPGPQMPVPLDEGRRIHVKGAVEVLLDASTHILMDGERVELSDELRAEIEEIEERFARDALRVLAGGYRDVPADQEGIAREDAQEGLTFLGVWGMLDPPRPAAVEAIRRTQRAGIRVVMITGDYAPTAAAIAEQAGIAGHGEQTVTGTDLDQMSDEELRERSANIAVYARVSPTHKIRIVKALQERGEIVAVTGDGVNDAPALKESSIGVAMGKTGTEVAKEAADMVLADDNFETIVTAVEEGRVIFNNLRNVVFFLLTTNLGEILTLTAAIVIGLPLPLTAVMILWVNLVTDGLSDIPVGLEPKHEDVLTQPPRPVDEGVVNLATIRRILLLAPVIAIGTLGLFVYELGVTDYERARTIAFTTLVIFEWFRAFSSRSQELSVFSIGLFSNRWLLAGIGTSIVLQNIVIYWEPAQLVFDTVALSAAEWALSVAVASSVLIVDEIRKFIAVRLA